MLGLPVGTTPAHEIPVHLDAKHGEAYDPKDDDTFSVGSASAWSAFRSEDSVMDGDVPFDHLPGDPRSPGGMPTDANHAPASGGVGPIECDALSDRHVCHAAALASFGSSGSRPRLRTSLNLSLVATSPACTDPSSDCCEAERPRSL